MTRIALMLSAAACLAAASPALAGPLVAGSGNEAVIEPPVPHPDETPCTVPLVADAKFGAETVTYAYTPPAACPGPWAVIVLNMALSVNHGVQFDRTGLLQLAGVPLWYGTTAEPRATLSPDWSFQKDVTDYTALFATAQSGTMQIPNYQSSTYPSTITASASLSFYPATSAHPAPVTADVVLPLPAGGGLATLNTGADQLSTTATLPTNIAHATLDLYLQAQIGDEFWYFCVPTALAGELESCGNTAFREGEVTVDGTPAGVAPIYPWIFTGGIDPYLWQPIPGVQTFDFIPFHADLSPFAGVLSNGQPHTIATSVFNANGYFSATGALRLFLDHGATAVTGGITRNTLTAANPNVAANITSTGGAATGSVDITSAHDFIISGTATGSAGRVVNTVTQSSVFTSNQNFNVSATRELQVTHQNTVTKTTSTSDGPAAKYIATTTLNYPLFIYYNFGTQANGYVQTTSVNQQYLSNLLGETGGLPSTQQTLTDAIATGDILFFDQNFSVTGHKSQAETADYARTGTLGPCVKRSLSARGNVISAVKLGC